MGQTVNMKKTSEIKRETDMNILDGIRVPHSISHPVIRFGKDGKYYLAFFLFYYTRADLQEGKVNRPSMWCLCDLENGQIIEKYDCEVNDFCHEPFDGRYSLKNRGGERVPKGYFESVYEELDSLRASYLENNYIPVNEYKDYYKKIVYYIPEDYRVFYDELSM